VVVDGGRVGKSSHGEENASGWSCDNYITYQNKTGQIITWDPMAVSQIWGFLTCFCPIRPVIWVEVFDQVVERRFEVETFG